MNEELATSTSELREEKRSTTRLQADLQGLKNELRRYEDIIEQGKRKESAVCEELNQLRSAYESTCE
jgi:Tfp pilus assembly protein PilN